MEKNQNNQAKKKDRQVKFEDVLAMYKYIKDIYAKIDSLDKRTQTLEKWVIEHK